jgi:gamma-glutamylcyclotransferase (GGCT)/AIG2-like uncharacterized protein YtfP
MLHWVFAYGSNMDLADVARWCRDRGREPFGVHKSLVGELPCHALVWNYHSEARRGAAANVERRPGRSLPGLVLRVDASGLAALDDKEGHPSRYRRALETVHTDSLGPLEAWIYSVQPSFVRSEAQAPTSDYIGIMLHAAERHGFPDWYLQELRELLP